MDSAPTFRLQFQAGSVRSCLSRPLFPYPCVNPIMTVFIFLCRGESKTGRLWMSKPDCEKGG